MRKELGRPAARVLCAIAVLLVLTLVCVSSLAALSYPFTATVTTDKVNVREAARSSSGIMKRMNVGDRFEVTGSSGSYYKISLGKKTGYILKDFVNTDADAIETAAPVKQETASGYPYDTQTIDSVNLRKSRSTSSALLRQIPKGAEITVRAVQGSWAEIDYKDKYHGYVKTDYINVKKIVKATATPTAAPTLSPEESSNSYQVLERGSMGSHVRALQQALIELGFLSGSVDGRFEGATEAAVIRFQETNEYPATGLVDANLQAFLYSGKPKDSNGKNVKINTLSPVATSMKLNNTGDAVGTLQEKLTELKYYSGEISCVYDKDVKTAVAAFQKKNGLKADGICGPATLEALKNNPKPADYQPTVTAKPTAAPTPVPTFEIPDTTVKRNSSGSDARLVQRRLKDLKYYKGTIDGKFGVLSVKALQEFQTANGLEADGIAGRDTYKVLFSLNALAKGETPKTATEVPVAVSVPTKTPAPAKKYETLRLGAAGEDVTRLQRALIDLGYLKDKADGTYGVKTALAVKEFQKKNKLSADGSAGAVTLTLLYEGKPLAADGSSKATATPKPTATPKSGNGSLREGDTGASVKELQESLISLGYLTGKADGIFGVRTYEAVVAFQKQYKLTADGIAGTKTLSKLGTEVGKKKTQEGPVNPTGTVVGKPDPAKVIYANWYTTVKAVARKYPYVTVYDFATGISWQEHIFSLGAHADAEPVTANDTAKMEKAFGGNTWNPKAVWVIFSDGSVYMASTHSMPHEVQHNTGNNFAGHKCIHFPRTEAQVASIGSYATSHQKMIDAGWATTQSMIR